MTSRSVARAKSHVTGSKGYEVHGVQVEERFSSNPNFNSGICDCCSDCGTMLMSWCCPCVQFGMNQEALGENGLLCGLGWLALACVGLPCILGGIRRSEMRRQYGIGGDTCGDVCCHWCCGCCAISQEAREIQHRQSNYSDDVVTTTTTTTKVLRPPSHDRAAPRGDRDMPLEQFNVAQEGEFDEEIDLHDEGDLETYKRNKHGYDRRLDQSFSAPL
jgi:Cys-rich protein (TIGR01571 family)